MNKEHLLAVADYVEPLGKVKAKTFDDVDHCSPREITLFTMSACSEKFPCGSAGCIAGVAVLLFGTDQENVPGSATTVMSIARGILGLTEQQADNLFVPPGDLWGITPQEAATAIRLFVNGPWGALESWRKARREDRW